MTKYTTERIWTRVSLAHGFRGFGLSMTLLQALEQNSLVGGVCGGRCPGKTEGRGEWRKRLKRGVESRSLPTNDPLPPKVLTPTFTISQSCHSMMSPSRDESILRSEPSCSTCLFKCPHRYTQGCAYQSSRHFSFRSSWQSRLIVTLVGDLRPHEWQNQGSNADLADGQDAGFFTMLLWQAHVGQRLEEAIARSKTEFMVILCYVMNPGFWESCAEQRSLTTFSVTCWSFFSRARLCTLWEKITCFIYICFDITTVPATSNYRVLQRWWPVQVKSAFSIARSRKRKLSVLIPASSSAEVSSVPLLLGPIEWRVWNSSSNKLTNARTAIQLIAPHTQPCLHPQFPARNPNFTGFSWRL